MGLDDFATSGTSRSQSSTVSKQKEDEKEEVAEEEEPFKVIGAGGGRKKVFHTEEQWESTKEFIEEEMSITVGELMNMEADKRHQILHKAILQDMGAEIKSFHPKLECTVCGETFVFPHDWDFERYKGEPVCPSHTIKEAKEAYEEINKLG